MKWQTFLVALVLVTALPHANADPDATETKRYTGGVAHEWVLNVSPLNSCGSSHGFGGVRFCVPAGLQPSLARFRVLDDSGLPTGGRYRLFDANGHGSFPTFFCDRETFEVPPGTASVEVGIGIMGLGAGCPGPGTQGTITVEWGVAPAPPLRLKSYLVDATPSGIPLTPGNPLILQAAYSCDATHGFRGVRFCGLERASPSHVTLTVEDLSGLRTGALVVHSTREGPTQTDVVCGTGRVPIRPETDLFIVQPGLTPGLAGGCLGGPATTGVVSIVQTD